MGRMLSRTRQVPGLPSALRRYAPAKPASGRPRRPLEMPDTDRQRAVRKFGHSHAQLAEGPGRRPRLPAAHRSRTDLVRPRRPPSSGKALIRVPIGAMLRVDLEIEAWQQIEFGVGELRWLLPPKVVCGGKNGK